MKDVGVPHSSKHLSLSSYNLKIDNNLTEEL